MSSFDDRVVERAKDMLPVGLYAKVPQYEYDGAPAQRLLGILPSADDSLPDPRAVRNEDDFFHLTGEAALVQQEAEALAVHVLQVAPRRRATGKACIRPSLQEQVQDQQSLAFGTAVAARLRRRRKLVEASADNR